MMTQNAVSLAWAMTLLERVSEPSDITEPVTEAELRQQMRIDAPIPSALVVRLGRVSREIVERQTNRAWAQQELAVTCGVRQPLLPLPLAFPLQELVSVTYRDEEGADVDLSASLYELDMASAPIYIDLSQAPESRSYRVVYRVGSETRAPEDIRHAILSLASWAYELPSGAWIDSGASRRMPLGDLPPMVVALCEPYRLETFAW